MAERAPHHRLNIYLDAPELREAIRVAAARADESLSEYCLTAIRGRLSEEGFLPPSKQERARAAAALDEARARFGPIGIPVRELIEEGRSR